jgi:predicted Holliday junction resolvase-like endonuclease
MSGKIKYYCAHLGEERVILPSEQAEYERYKKAEAEFIRRVEKAVRHRYVTREEYDRVRRMSYDEFVEWLENHVMGTLMLVSEAEDDALHYLHDVVIGKRVEKIIPTIPGYDLPAKKIRY